MQHILVVDDNPVDRALARGMLEDLPGVNVEFASNGAEALEHLEATTPLAIVTDLNMPEMDGLALVRSVRRGFPTVPVVLMTAFGSEELALEALLAGAADYVPKHRLAQDLARSVEGVLTTGQGDWQRERMSPYLRYMQLGYELPRDLHLIPPLVNQLLAEAAALTSLESVERVRLAKCLAEAIHNAMVHGTCDNLDDQTATAPSAACLVTVSAELTPTAGQFVIRDPGPGFDHSVLVDPRRSPTQLTRDSGKGLALIQLFMDEVRFNEPGNQITLVKRWKSAEGAAVSH